MIIFRGGPLNGYKDSVAASGSVVIARWLGGTRGYRLSDTDDEQDEDDERDRDDR